MTLPTHPRTIATTAEGEEQPLGLIELPQRQKVVLVMDLVESVRLMAANERAVIDHWRGFVQHATTDVLPRHRGRMVKSLGDGIMAEFDSARDGTNAALALQRFFDGANATLPHDQQLYLRAGLNATHVYVDDIDIYGSGVNLAARVAGLAGPGEVMVTAEVRDGLTDGLDAVVEDMGECYLKHVAEPVRAYRVGAGGARSILMPVHDYATSLHPTVAVLPFESRKKHSDEIAIGSLIADGVIARLSKTEQLKVVSRLSTSAFAGRRDVVRTAGDGLGADYLLEGSYLLTGEGANGTLLVTSSLTGVRDSAVLWRERFSIGLPDLFEVDSEACNRIATGAHRAVFDSTAKRVAFQPMPTLESYSLLLGGIRLMHRSTASDMQASRRLLEHLIDRHPRSSEAYAWLAKSFVLNAVSSFSRNSEEALRALKICREGLSRSQGNALALAVQAHIHTHIDPNPELALAEIEQAIERNPNEPLAWLFKSVLSAMWGSPESAVDEASHATSLSPVDPLGYYYKMLLASAQTIRGNVDLGAALARESLRLNRYHTPTWRVLITAQVHGGDLIGGRSSMQELLKLDPSFSIERYRAAGNADSHTKRQFVVAANELGYR